MGVQRAGRRGRVSNDDRRAQSHWRKTLSHDQTGHGQARPFCACQARAVQPHERRGNESAADTELPRDRTCMGVLAVLRELEQHPQYTKRKSIDSIVV
jgi:hypothetical protein